MPKIKSFLRLNSSGVTLTELMVVIVLLAILFIASNLIFKDVLANSRDARRKADLTQIQKGLELYRSDNASYPATLNWGGQLTSPAGGTNYLNPIPVDPKQAPYPQYAYVPSPAGCTTACATYDLYSKLEKPAAGTPTYDVGGVTYDYKTPPPPPPGSATPTTDDRSFGGPTSTPTPTPGVGPSKKAFITSNTYWGNLQQAGSNVGLGVATSGLDGADKICQSRANAASLGGTWKAWLSTHVNSAGSRLSHNNGPYTLVDGTTVIANNWTDLTSHEEQDSNALRAPLNMTELGTTLDSWTWTDTEPNGNSTSATFHPTDPSDCLEWTTHGPEGGMGNRNAIRGYSGFPSGAWTSLTMDNCGSTYPLYCFEQ